MNPPAEGGLTPGAPADAEVQGQLFQVFLEAHARTLKRFYRRSDAGRWKLSTEEVAFAAQRSVLNRFRATSRLAPVEPPSSKQIAEHVDSLHAEDLALARACELGREEAWQHFVSRYRPILFRLARRVVDDDARAHELADGLYADLYGTQKRKGQRFSLLAHYHGRSRLTTWLRAVLARRAIDLHREDRRKVPLDDDPPSPNASADPPEPERARLVIVLRRVLGSLLGALEPRDRFRLCAYYLDGLTLAQVGRLTGEHESTVSRRVARTVRRLRKELERALRKNENLSRDQIRLACETVLGGGGFEIRSALAPGLQDPARRTFPSGGNPT